MVQTFWISELFAIELVNNFSLLCISPRHSGLMASALNSGASGPGSSPGQGHCIMFSGKTLYSHGASLHPGV